MSARAIRGRRNARRGTIALRRLILFAACWVLAAPAFAEKRVALVIGNAAYKHAPALANPRNDAEAMAAALKRLKFEVIAGVDLDEAATRRLLREFAEKLDGFGKEDVAVLFYAGHGLQVNGRNYLVPVDARLERERDLDFQAVPFDFVQSLMEKTLQTNIVILDSCRDNPLARTLARGMSTRSTLGRGLAEMRGINDTLIVYATNPGNVALDGQGRHSPFTEALLKHVEQPGLEVRHMISQVRAAVITATKGQQVPWEAASLTRQVFFAAAAPAAAAPAPTPATPAAPTPAAPTAPQSPGADGEIVFWQSIQNSKNAADYKAYLEKYPKGTFAELAKLRIAEIEKAAVTPPAPAPVPEKPTPRPPRRTSTMQPGFAYSNAPANVLGGKPYFDVANAQACAERCIQTPQCAAWTFWNRVPQCYLLRAAHQGVPNSDFTAGVIRTTPAAAPAQPPAPKAQPSAPEKPSAPQSGDPLVRELIRKGTAREKENGFCAKVSWPPYYGSYCELEKMLGDRSSGLVSTSGVGIVSSSCVVTQISAETREGGKRYRFFQQWYCSSQGCSSGSQRVDLSTCP
jgi:uncharacterized caspase-like protein